MIYISHRGNTNGKDPSMENNPDYILDAIQKGFDVEVDLWIINKKIFLGHDFPQYKLDIKFLYKIADKAWLHCKNLEALYVLHNSHPRHKLKYFWHEEDKFSLTSNKFIWTYPGEIGRAHV